MIGCGIFTWETRSRNAALCLRITRSRWILTTDHAMKRWMLAFVTLLLPFALVHAQYQPQCPYLLDPDLAIGYVDSCASFWLNAWDDAEGGFYTNIDREGSVISSWGRNKNMISQSRDAYGMARAFMLTGNEEYLDIAQAALDFQYAHAWDSEYGGWFSELAESGAPVDPNEQKTAFNQHYALLGPTAVFEASRRGTDWQMIEQATAWMDTVLWDSRVGVEGYYDRITRDHSHHWDKSFNATVDAITTHLLSLYLLTEDARWLERMQEMAREVQIHLVASMPDQAIGFVEEYDRDWNRDDSETMTIMGHVLKSGWCLARLHQLAPEISLLDDAQTLTDEVWNNGYDHTFGGPYKDYNRVTGDMLLWGIPDTAKAWWQMEQAVVGGLQMYDVTGEDRYLQMADESLDFFMRYFVDHEYGDVYSDRTRYGGQAWGEEKGSGGKAAYHSIETGYYACLYGHLLLRHEPVTLHYRFAPVDSARTVRLSPLAMPDVALTIAGVTLDGAAYTAFVPDTRELNIPAGIGGHFAVEFDPVQLSAPEEVLVSVPGGLDLTNAWPNPFNGQTTLEYRLQRAGDVHVSLVNLLGREVLRMSEKQLSAGVHRAAIRADELASGVYIARVSSGGETSSIRLVLIK